MTCGIRNSRAKHKSGATYKDDNITAIGGFLANVNSYQLTSTSATHWQRGWGYGASGSQILEGHRCLRKSGYQYSPALGAQSWPPGATAWRQIRNSRRNGRLRSAPIARRSRNGYTAMHLCALHGQTNAVLTPPVGSGTDSIQQERIRLRRYGS